MATTEEPQEIKTIEDWLRRVKELEEEFDKNLVWPFPKPEPDTTWDNWKPIE